MRESQYEMFKGGEVLGNGSSLSMNGAITVPEARDVLVNQPSLFEGMTAEQRLGMPSWAWVQMKVRRSKEMDSADWLMKSWEDPRQADL